MAVTVKPDVSEANQKPEQDMDGAHVDGENYQILEVAPCRGRDHPVEGVSEDQAEGPGPLPMDHSTFRIQCRQPRRPCWGVTVDPIAIYPVRQYLVAGEFAVDVAEDHGGEADVDDELGGEQPGLGVTDPPVEKVTESHRGGAVDDVAENEPEEQGVGEEHEQGWVDLAVARPSHQIGDQLHRFARVAIGELDRREFEFGSVVTMSAATGHHLVRLDVDDSTGL